MNKQDVFYRKVGPPRLFPSSASIIRDSFAYRLVYASVDTLFVYNGG